MSQNEKYDERFDAIYEMLSGSVIRGMVFSIYDKFGPQTLYSFPPAVEQAADGFGMSHEERINEKVERFKKFMLNKTQETLNQSDIKHSNRQNILQIFSQRDYLQIAIKSVSLLIGEKIFEKDKSLLDLSFFGVLPYPDLDVCAHTFFRFYSYQNSDELKAITFSLLIDNNRRSFIYDNINFLKTVITEAVDQLVFFLERKEWGIQGANQDVMEKINDVILDFFMKLKLAEDRPFTPIASKRQIKIIFTGLKNSGKTSFLLSTNRKYSELIRRDTTRSSDVKIANMLGTTIVNWDLGVSNNTRNKFTTQAGIYLYDANLIYYFIDGTDFSSLEESRNWFEILLRNLKKMGTNIPILIVISKLDSDLSDKPEIRKFVSNIKTKFSEIALKYMKNFKFFESSIFNLSSILTTFSNGITLLSPNRDIAEYKLREYSKILNASAIMLFNENGLIISQYTSDPDFDLKHEYSLKYVFETLGPQYIGIFKNMDLKAKSTEKRMSRHKFNFLTKRSKSKNALAQSLSFKTNVGEKSTIFMKKIYISDLGIYILMYLNAPFLKDEELQRNLDKLIVDFTEILQIYVI